MSIAEKLITIAENEQRVFDAGYYAGKASGGGSSVDPDKIIEKTVTGTMIAVDDVSEVNHECTITNLSDEDVTVNVCGKNLWDFNSGVSKVTYVAASGTVGTRWGYAIKLPAGTYTIHAELVGEAGSDYIYCKINTKDGTHKADCNILVSTTYIPQTITLDDGDVLFVYDGWNYPTAAEVNSIFARYGVQIETERTATPYEPYVGDDYELYAGQSITVDGISPKMAVYTNAGVELSLAYRASWGKHTEWSEFWDVFQDYGNRANYNYAFWCGWNDTNFRPKYDIKPTKAEALFQHTKIVDLAGALKKCGVKLDFSVCTHPRMAFYYSQTLKTVPEIDCRSFTQADPFYYMFGSATIESIEKIILKDDGSQNLAQAFTASSGLKEVRFEGVIGMSLSFVNSNRLTTESVQSAIDHLKDLTGATAQTLTLHATVGGKLTDAQKAAITAKNWTLVY